MRLKLDENLGRLAAELLRLGGHDVETVPTENLCSAPDRVLLETCRAEARCSSGQQPTLGWFCCDCLRNQRTMT